MNQVSPHIAVCPYLQLRDPIVVGDWWFGPIDDFDGRWATPPLEDAARAFLSRFVDHDGKRIARPTLVAHRHSGVDGDLPPSDIRAALALTIEFLVLDANPDWSEETRYDAWRVSTTDNADLWFQPLDPTNGCIALERGARVRTTAGGYRLSDPTLTIQPPRELHLPSPTILDRELADSLFTVLTRPSPASGPWPSRIRVAIRWLAKAWHNSTSITDEDRVVHLKTASEGLTGTSNTHKAQQQLVKLFETTANQPGDGIGVDDLLWSPTEPTYERSLPGGGGEPVKVTALGHWFHGLGHARNRIIHDGATPAFDYHHQSSPYNGPLVDVGERVLREAIKVALGQCGFPAVWRQGMARASYEAHVRLSE